MQNVKEIYGIAPKDKFTLSWYKKRGYSFRKNGKEVYKKMQIKLPENTTIKDEKITQYLLIPKKRNDKSKWLFQAGYTQKNWQIPEADLREQILSKYAKPIEKNEYGAKYKIKGHLTGPNGSVLSVVTIWLKDVEGKTKFVTMYPDKREK